MTSFETIHHIIHKELGLVMTSAHLLSKLLSKERKEESVRCSKTFIKLIQNQK
jgi:hypothetical protein